MIERFPACPDQHLRASDRVGISCVYQPLFTSGPCSQASRTYRYRLRRLSMQPRTTTFAPRTERSPRRAHGEGKQERNAHWTTPEEEASVAGSSSLFPYGRCSHGWFTRSFATARPQITNIMSIFPSQLTTRLYSASVLITAHAPAASNRFHSRNNAWDPQLREIWHGGDVAP
jgi:hypothetical protein